MQVKSINSINNIDKYIDFFKEVFSEFTTIDDDSFDRKKELMMSQFNENPDYLMYIEENGKIVAALFSYYSQVTNTIIVDLIGVLKGYRLHNFGTILLDELYKKAVNNNVSEIVLTSKTNNYDFYLKNSFMPVLNYVVFHEISTEELDKLNKYGFKLYEDIIYHRYFLDGQNVVSTRVKYIVDYPKEKYLEYYNKLFDNCHAGYFFARNVK